MSSRMKKGLAIAALRKALMIRQPLAAFIALMPSLEFGFKHFCALISMRRRSRFWDGS
jgi:hypothetical protein